MIRRDLGKIPFNKMLFNKTFVDNGVIAVSFGIVYALLLTPNKYSENSHLNVEVYLYLSLKNLKRVLIVGIVTGVLFIVLELISGTNIYLLFFLKMQFFFILVMTFYTCLLP